MYKEYLQAVCRADQEVNPLFAFLGARLTHAENGTSTLVLPVSMRLCQGGGLVAGGILATLADEAMAHAVMTKLEPMEGTVTAEMNIRYLRGTDPKQGGELVAKARVIKRGRHMIYTEAHIYDSRERMLAVCGATFYVMPGQTGDTYGGTR